MTRLSFLLLALLGGLALLHGNFYLAGFRMTADEVYFLDHFLRGPQALWNMTRSVSQGHGRIGFHLLIPVNGLASYLSEFLIWRIVFVALYGLVAVMVFFYAARLLKAPIAGLAFVLWLCLHPLAFEHMPPNSYPLQNTLPALVFMACRLWELDRPCRPFAPVWLVLALMQIIALVATEYTILMALVLLPAEFLVRHPVRLRAPNAWLRGVFTDPHVLRDITIMGIVALTYFTYRILNPNTYAGTQLNGLSAFEPFAYTTWNHISSGITATRLSSDVFDASLRLWAMAGAGALSSALAFWLLLRRSVVTLTGRQIAAACLWLVLGCIIVTVPLSGTAKLQDWCWNGGDCGYLDSRISVLGVALILTLLASRLRAHKTTAGIAGLLALLTFLHNGHVAQQMQGYTDVWSDARDLACFASDLPETNAHVRATVDPTGLIRHFHDESQYIPFWQRYFDRIEDHSDCQRTAAVQRAQGKLYLPYLTPDAPVDFITLHSNLFKRSGWSNSEPTGVWTDGPEAVLEIIPGLVPAGATLSVILTAQPLLDLKTRTQRLRVTQDGQEVLDITLTAEACCTIVIPLQDGTAVDTPTLLTLHMPDAHPPADSTDTRVLGLFVKMVALAVRDS